MSLVRRIARPLLAAAFIESGADDLLHPAAKAELARPVAARLAPPLGLPEDPELFVRVAGAVRVGAGTLYAAGRLPRLSALALSATVLADVLTGEPFWAAKDPDERRRRRLALTNHLALLGAALMAAVDTEGRPGLAWRGRHAAQHGGRGLGKAVDKARKAAPLPG